jgi:hypothetical protein
LRLQPQVDDLDDEVFEEKLAANHAELRELASPAAKLEQGSIKSSPGCCRADPYAGV